MVGLHVLYNEIIGLFAVKHALNVCKPLFAEMRVNAVENGDFVVENDVGIVRHTVGNDVLPLEQINAIVVYADVFNIVCDNHICSYIKIYFLFDEIIVAQKRRNEQ